MASNPDFVQYIADQCAGAGEITVKKMFGDYGIYCDGKIFGLICDGRCCALSNCARPTMEPRTISSSPTWMTTTTLPPLSARPARTYPTQNPR